MTKYTFRQKGFTLVELIIVIAIVAILAAAIFVAIDPARRLHESRNTRRWSDVQTILDAVKKYQADNAGTHYTTITSKSNDVYYLIGTNSGICVNECTDYTTQSSCLDLTDIGTNYLAVVPQDPQFGTASETGYALKKDSSGAITIIACEPEGEGAGGAGVPPTISVTR